jgi:hypothetical protein
MQAGRIRGNVGEMVVKQVSGGSDVLDEKGFAAYMHRAVLQGEISASRASMILGVACDGGFSVRGFFGRGMRGAVVLWVVERSGYWYLCGIENLRLLLSPDGDVFLTTLYSANSK